MMSETLVFYVSGHGFGHASRAIEVINEIGARRPDLRIAVRTAAARWLFDLTLSRPVDVRRVECDTGVAQIGSLSLDEAETIRRADAFHSALDRRADEEAAFLRSAGATLVVADIPPLAFAAARKASIASVALGNFTWDWIYEHYGDRLADAPGLLPVIRDAYRQAGLALRLPMWGGFASIPESAIVDIPLIARRARRSRDDVRHALGLPLDGRVVLLSFGGFGLETLDLSRLAGLSAYTVVSTGHVGARSDGPAAGIIEIDERALYGSGLRYEDLVAASDVVATKPGYGIIAECAANGAAILYTSRGRFAEYNVLVEAMPRLVRSHFIPQEAFLAGHWAPYLDTLLSQERPPRPAVDGAEVAASLILEQLDQ